MKHERNGTASGGIGFSGLLQVAFIVLKLCRVIDWSWWIVLLPTIIPCGILVVMFAWVLWINNR